MPRAEAGSTKAISNKIKSVCLDPLPATNCQIPESLFFLLTGLNRKDSGDCDGIAKLAKGRCAMRMGLNGESLDFTNLG